MGRLLILTNYPELKNMRVTIGDAKKVAISGLLNKLATQHPVYIADKVNIINDTKIKIFTFKY